MLSEMHEKLNTSETIDPNAGRFTVRLKFKKVGNLQYISHLDLQRTFNRVIKRSGIPAWYTKGFNPHMKLVFSSPLSIGTESVCEYMDLRLSERVCAEEAMQMLNKNMTREMQVIEAYYPERKLTDLKWLSYTITIKTNGATDELAKMCEQALYSDKIEVEKKTKSGPALVDIRPLIRSAYAVCDGDLIRISAVLSADQSTFLNPEYVVKALKAKCGILSDPCLTNEYYSIMRERAYLDDMTDFA